jgi:hypothetical protein
LIEFYQADSTEVGLTVLKQLGIQYIVTNSYVEPAVYNSSLIDLLGDPEYSQLLEEINSERLYLLAPTPEATTIESAGRYDPVKSIYSVSTGKGNLCGGMASAKGTDAKSSIVIRKGDQQKLNIRSVVSGDDIANGNSLPLMQGNYFVKMRMSGQGYVQLKIFGYDCARQAVKYQLGEFVLTGVKDRLLKFQFIASADHAAHTFELETTNPKNVTLNEFELYRIKAGTEQDSSAL